MGIISKMERRSIENPAVPLSSANISEVFSTSTPSGVSVTSDKALGLTAFWAGVRVISQTIAGLPCKPYERTPNGRRLADEHEVYQVLQVRPNPMMSPFTFREIRAAHCLTWGNSYAEIERDNAGRVMALWPLLPDRTGVEIKDGKKLYWTIINNNKIYLASDKVLHVPGLGFDGLQGYNVIKVHRDSLGLSIAANEYGSTFFGNSGRPSGVLSHPGSIEPADRTQLREEWNQMHSGLTRAQRTAVLWGGMTWTPITLPPEEAQFLQTRDMQIEEIARILMINPIFLQHFSKVTTWGSGVMQFLTAFSKFTILPWLEREEDALNYELFKESERGKYYVKYSIEELMRGDPKMQAEILEIERRNGIVNADEWRQLKEENPLPGGLGKDYYMPWNMAPVSILQKQPEPVRSVRQIESRSVDLRVKMREAHLAAFEDGVRRYVKRDVEGLKKAVNAILKKREEPVIALKRWVEEFYPAQEKYIAQAMKPLVGALAAIVATAAADEVGADAVDVDQFVADYVLNLAKRESDSSIGQILAMIREIPADELADKLITRADEWEEKRPGKVAENEVVRVENGVARYVWGTVGVSYLVWRANAGACPLCAQLDGKRVGIKEYFLMPGESVSPEGTTPLVAEANIGGPPLHAGCKCSIVASQ
jgi:HK97 family phage portal protein